MKEIKKEVKLFLGKNYHDLFIQAGYIYMNGRQNFNIPLTELLTYPSVTTRWIKQDGKHYQAEIFDLSNRYIVWVSVHGDKFLDKCDLYLKMK